MKSIDPYGQEPRGESTEVYGPKNRVLTFIAQQQKELASLKRAMQIPVEIINDATRAAVFRELINDLKSEAGTIRYNASYEGYPPKDMELVSRLEGWIEYLTKYSHWGQKFLPDGSLKAPTLEEKIDSAYIRGGASEVLKLMSK